MGTPTARRLGGCLTLRGQARGVTLRPGGQLTAVGAILGHARQAVVLANQSDRDLCEWLPLARTLERHRFEALVFDYSGADPQADVAAAVRALRRGRRGLGGPGRRVGRRPRGPRRRQPEGRRPLGGRQPVGRERRPHRAAPDHPLRAPAAGAGAAGLLAAGSLHRRGPGYPRAVPRCGLEGQKRLLLEPGDAHGVDLLAGARGRGSTATVLSFLRRP